MVCIDHIRAETPCVRSTKSFRCVTKPNPLFLVLHVWVDPGIKLCCRWCADRSPVREQASKNVSEGLGLQAKEEDLVTPTLDEELIKVVWLLLDPCSRHLVGKYLAVCGYVYAPLQVLGSYACRTFNLETPVWLLVTTLIGPSVTMRPFSRPCVGPSYR